jgi:hypothetical protein
MERELTANALRVLEARYLRCRGRIVETPAEAVCARGTSRL